MQFDSLEIQKNIEEKRLILAGKFEEFLLKKLLKIPAFFARVFAAKSTAFFGALFVVMASVWVQSTRDVGHDTATYFEVAEKMLAGGRYFYDFFESNLPLSFLLTMIPILLARAFDFNVIATAEIFWNLLGILSIYSANRILSRSELVKDRRAFNFIILTFAVGFFWRSLTLQFNELGTKTTYLLVILFPYISYHLLTEKELKNFDQILSGILAGLLFCLKPHYGIFVIVFELEKIIRKQNLLTAFCLRNYVTLALLISYLAILFKFFPDYLDKALALSSAYYSSAYNMIFSMLVQDVFPILLLLVLCFEIIKKEEILWRLFLPVIAAILLILSELIGGLDQRFILYSTALPLVVLILIKSHQINWCRDWILIFLILFLPQFDPQNIFSLASYLACFWWVFALFLFTKWQISKRIKILLTLAALVTIGLLITENFTRIPWITSLIIFIAIIYLDQKSHERISQKKDFSRLSVCVIFLALSYLLSLNLAAIFNSKSYYDSYKFSSPNHFNSEIIKSIKHYSRKDESVITIMEGIPGIYPSIIYAEKKNDLPFLQYGILFQQIAQNKIIAGDTSKYMMQSLKQQLQLKKNKLVFIEIQRHPQQHECIIGALEYYFRDQEFKKIFLENYVFLTRIFNVMEGEGDAKIINHDAEVYIRK